MNICYTVSQQCSNPTDYTVKCGYDVGDPIALERILLGMDGRKLWKAR